ncbi:MAG: hypothetical protein ACI4EN_01390 [Butyrivibrio sp.]
MSKKTVLKIIYIVVFWLALAVPGVWTFIQGSESIGNEDKTDFSNVTYVKLPGKINDYMSTGFGFRNKLVQINNRLYYNLFGESGEDSVIAGLDGWLFYESALGDYTGEARLTDAEIARIVKVLEIAEKSVREQGAEFIFVSAPNKMEIYGEYMPYYCYEDSSAGNYERLFTALGEAGVSNTDLKSLLKEKARNSEYILYHKQDSHWNNLGAAYACEAIMQEAGLEYIRFTDSEYTVRKDFSGDLYAMLFPKGDEKDEQVYFNTEENFYYVSNYRSPEDMVIETENERGSGSLLMYRDSFGNALHTFMAENFASSVFHRELPYNFTETGDKSLVAVELVERNLANLLIYPPVVKPQSVNIENTFPTEYDISARADSHNGYTLITIKADCVPEDCVNVYVRIGNTDTVYEAYPCGKDGDVSLYLEELKDNQDISLIYEQENEYFETLQTIVKQ